MSLGIDFETRSVLDLRKVGVYKYAEHPLTDIICMAWGSDEDVRIWYPGDPIPAELVEAVESGQPLRAWNASFERIIWREILGPRYGFPVPKNDQWFCTAAEAAAMALPRKLDDAASVLNVAHQKDKEGAKLMQKMTKPRAITKKFPELRWHDDPQDVWRLGEYCMQDVRAEQAVAKRLRRLSPSERKVYLLDQRMNDRGVMIDLPLVHAAQEIVDVELAKANRLMDQITDGGVGAVTKVADLTRWVNGAGVEMDNMQKGTVRDTLAERADELPDSVREALELRAESGLSSLAKLKAMVAVACADGRARGLLLYHAASTGRWAGRLIQPQNFVRSTIKNVERYINQILARENDLIALEHPPLVVLSSLMRGMLRASDDHRLIAIDFAQIEARVLAWLADQKDLIELFASGGKVYEEMAAFIQSRKLGRTVLASEIKNPSEERQIGKNTVLGAGFQMGWERFIAYVKEVTGIDVSEEDARAAISGYRERAPMIVNLWYDTERAAKIAVMRPGSVTSVGVNGCVKFVVREKFLWCILPSGRPLAYALPQLSERKTKYGIKTQLSYMAVNSKTHQWAREYTYGGKLVENIVQAIARDLMTSAMLRLDEASYPNVLCVHDEVVMDVPNGFGTLEEALELMKRIPKWAQGCPVAVEGWQGERYRK